MIGWLRAAGRAFQRGTTQAPQTFQLRCACGTSVAGERTRSCQRILCPACQTPLFVVPASVYPLPKPPNPGKGKKDAPQRSAPLSQKKGAQKAVRFPKVIEYGDEGRAAIQADPRTAGSATAARKGLLRQWLSPVRLVLVCVAVVVGATASWISHHRTLERAQSLLDSSSKKGREALAGADFAAAAAELEQASQALVLLGRTDDPQARGIRQLWSESRAGAGLSLKSLHTIVSEAVTAESSVAPSSWKDVFRASYKDSWVLMDASIVRTGNSAPLPPYRVEYPIFVGQNGAVGVANLRCFNVLPADRASQRVIFAAQLEDCRRDPDVPRAWQIVLRPETAFLLASPARADQVFAHKYRETLMFTGWSK